MAQAPDRQKDFIRYLKKQDCSDGYIHRIVGTLIALLNYAYKRQEIAYVPFVQLPPRGEGRDRILTIEEMAAFFNAIPNDSEHLFMYCMLACPFCFRRARSFFDPSMRYFAKSLASISPASLPAGIAATTQASTQLCFPGAPGRLRHRRRHLSLDVPPVTTSLRTA